MSTVADLALLLPGDILLEAADGGFYGGVARLFGQRHQHAFLYVGEGKGVQAVGTGVEVLDMARWNPRWRAVRPRYGIRVARATCDAAKEDLGGAYGVPSLLAHMLYLKTGVAIRWREEVMVCSGYLCKWSRLGARRAGHAFDLVPAIEDELTSPDAIWDSPNVMVLF